MAGAQDYGSGPVEDTGYSKVKSLRGSLKLDYSKVKSLRGSLKNVGKPSIRRRSLRRTLRKGCITFSTVTHSVGAFLTYLFFLKPFEVTLTTGNGEQKHGGLKDGPSGLEVMESSTGTFIPVTSALIKFTPV